MGFTFDNKTLLYIRDYPHILGHMAGKTKLTAMHSNWAKYSLCTPYHTALQASRGFYKTTIIPVIGSMWWLLFHPSDRIAIVREKYSDAAEVVNTVKNLMMLEPIQKLFEFAHGFAPKATTKRENKLVFNFKRNITQEGNIDAYGVETIMTGKHYDKIICDDIITLKDRTSKAKREYVKEVIREIMTNVIDPGKFVSFIGTPWHRDDGWSIIEKIVGEIKRYSIHDCDILSEAEIAEKRRTTTALLFAANYLLKHIVDENALFPEAFYDKWSYKYKNTVLHIDAGYDGDNYTALTFLGLKPNGRLQGIGKVFQEHVDTKYDFIKLWYKKLYTGSCYMEKNADKGFLAKELKKYGIAIKPPYHEDMNKHIKISTYLKKWWDKIDWDEEMTDAEYLNQILDYMEGQEPDDAPDSAASLLRQHFETSAKLSMYKK